MSEFQKIILRVLQEIVEAKAETKEGIWIIYRRPQGHNIPQTLKEAQDPTNIERNASPTPNENGTDTLIRNRKRAERRTTREGGRGRGRTAPGGVGRRRNRDCEGQQGKVCQEEKHSWSLQAGPTGPESRLWQNFYQLGLSLLSSSSPAVTDKVNVGNIKGFQT